MQQQKLNWSVQAGGHCRGRIRVPGDKSISHRSVMLGSIANGRTRVRNFLNGEDCISTMRAFKSMGVGISCVTDTELEINGVGLHGLHRPPTALDLGNSGTSMRLMSGLLGAQKFSSTLVGDASLSRRPMNRVIDPLTRMGARIESRQGCAPLEISGVDRLRAIRHQSAVASAQVKSCLLLAGLYADGLTEVVEPGLSRDHTERMLGAFGVQVEAGPGRAAIGSGQELQGTDIDVPADISSATFFILAAMLHPNSDLVLTDVGVNPTRSGVIEIFRSMGGRIDVLDERAPGGEPVADLRVRSSDLQGAAIDPALVPSAIDEFPAVFVAAACATGETTVTGAAELRVKESDRIQVMIDGLRSLGVEAESMPDGARIRGGALQSGTIDSHGDHRVAMSFAMAALRAKGPVHVLDCLNVNTSFPGFSLLATEAAGISIVSSS